MRKIVCIILVSLLLCLTACGGDTASEQPTPTPTVEVTVTPDCAEPTPTPTPTPVPTPTWSEEPETMTIMLEGMEETMYGYRYTSALGYSMVYDPDWVRPEQREGYDHYTAVTEIDVPELYLRVTKAEGSVEQVIADLEAQGAEKVGNAMFGGFPCVQLSKMSGYGPADVVVNYYVMQAGNTVFVPETSYFWEAAEGFGTRMWYMLDSIRFADAPAATELKLMFRDKEIKDFTSAIGDVTYVTLLPNAGAYLEAAEWTTDNEDVCELYTDDSGCYIEIKAEGNAKVTAKCGDLEKSVFVRAINSW
ncbi:MAG: hypothetical protein IJA67_07745 [Oscillospiraceae bacterium]|nr:hypothetical protein [Oscillospiraceae bacterium]